MPLRLFLVVVFSCCPLAWGSPPTVLVTVKPLQLIAQAITHGVTDVTTLLPAHVDPHTYALRPSDIGQLNDADLVVWAGPGLETYLAKTVETLESSKQIVTMDADNNNHHAGDAHYWMGSRHARQLARQIAAVLVEIDPQNAEAYRRNLGEFQGELSAIDNRIRESLANLDNRSFLVYHDAFGSFEEEYGLHAAGEIRPHEEVRTGARHLLHLRSLVEDQGLNCIVVPPGPLPQEVAIVAGDYPVRFAVLDPLAGDIDVERRGYIRFLVQTAERMIDCLE